MRIALLGMAIASAILLCFHPAAAVEKQSPSEEEFCRLDRDSDREITPEEFAACEFYKLERMKKLPYADVERYDREKKGRLTEEEMKAYLFDRADKNKNRKLERREWEEFYNSLKDTH
jgi:hypothetical protein